MKKVLFGILVLGLIATLGWALKKRPASSISERSSRDQASVDENRGSLQRAQSAMASEAKTAALPSGPAEKPSVAPSAQNSMKAQSLPSQLAQDLKQYRALAAKTFLTADEERQKQEMLRDRGFLRDLGGVLSQTTYMLDPQFEEAENSALDLLVESLQKGDRDTSLEVIQTIIQDKQVENEKLPQEVREVLAGIKGELLYHAAALEPQVFANVAQTLPGPVSQKIWQNVQEKHRNNLAESQTEVAQHEAKWGRH